jgi:hypothetical protein
MQEKKETVGIVGETNVEMEVQINMADIELVIKIPEEEYNYVKTQVKIGITNPLKMRIANGTPLPKGHGRLIDADKIEWYGCTTEFDCPYKDRECKDCNRAECSKTQVDDIPTIIEADKESEE